MNSGRMLRLPYKHVWTNNTTNWLIIRNLGDRLLYSFQYFIRSRKTSCFWEENIGYFWRCSKHPILKNEHLANLKHPNRVWSPRTGENQMIIDLLLTQDLQEDLQSSRSSSCSMVAPRKGWRRSTS